jgi:cyclase
MTVADDLARTLLGCRIVDLSCDLNVCEPGPFETRVEVIEAADGADIFCEKVLPNLVAEAVGTLRPEHFPDRAFLRHEMVHASVHAGSHIDAPGHYGSNGFINEAPPETFVGRGIMLDVTGAPEWQVPLREVEAAIDASGVTDFGQSIVLIHTEHTKAIAADAVEALLDRGVRVIGTDANGFDGGFAPIVRRFLEREDPATLWPAHFLGRRRPFYQIERMRNLELLPATGFLVIALPVRVAGATAAWTRAVAFVPHSGP